MGKLMMALAEGREPATNGEDNLQSLEMAYAAVTSSESGGVCAVSGGAETQGTESSGGSTHTKSRG